MRHCIRYWSIGAILVAAAAAAADPAPLASSPSGYVRAQATSGVKWHAWNEASLGQAKASGRSVYVFIGSPLSELSRATISQTFGSEKTVAWLNESFYCIFVDADVQPDVAAYGQHFINTVKQLRGQPVHLWLTPDTLQPYDGANYLPPSEEWGKPGFLKAARAALDTWSIDSARARALAAEAIDLMRLPPLDPTAKIDVGAKLASAARAWTAAADPVHGGFGTAPKLPEPELIRFLLTRDAPAREAAIKAARAIVNGALRDAADGGFHRRCIDEAWKEPYFQKTLADQARIALALFDAADAAQDDSLRRAGVAALDFALKELRHPDGTFAAALDGTLEENTDPAHRPRFAKVGQAPTAALGLLVVALHESLESRLVAEASRLAAALCLVPLPHIVGQPGIGTAADHLAASWGVWVRKHDDPAHLMLVQANERYFDATLGTYLATPPELPAGIAVRVPAVGETVSADALALISRVSERTGGPIRHHLMRSIEYDELPPGDVLLGLSRM